MFETLKKILRGDLKINIEKRRAIHIEDHDKLIAELEKTLWVHIKEKWVVPKNNDVETYYKAKVLWMNNERAIRHPFPFMAATPHDIRWLPEALTPEVLEILADNGFVSRKTREGL